jgi:thiol:disulfide interchange protein
MKKFLTFFILLVSFIGNSQIVDPVKWTTKVVQISNDEFELVMDAKIDYEWHIYSQFTPEWGPQPAVFEYKSAKGNYTLVGKTKESPYKKVFNKDFEVDEYYFADKAQFKQRIKVTNTKLKEVKVYLEYQVCKEQCSQQDKTFTFKLPEIKEVAKVEEKTTESPEVKEEKKTEEVAAVIEEVVEKDTSETKVDKNREDIKQVDKTTSEVSTKNENPDDEKKGLLTIFILAFFSGFAALLTPCVFPMIPMTVSFFTKQSKTKAEGKKNAILYGISIIVIYVILGSLVTAIFGSDALNALSTNVWFNIIFFILLIVFAASFLGAFEIVLPNSWANKIDRQADRGGIIGILFMALALAIVSFSCTGPIVGTLLVEAASKGGLAPVIGMFGFSLALALPFMLFAMFPGWMNTLPKSGGWLNTVKVSLGFLELALAFKFLSKADLVTQSHLLPREVFLAVWIAVFGAWALYLFGKITLPHDSAVSHISVGRLFLALLVTSFTFYLIPGLWGAPLKIISGFPPPLYYSESPNGVGGSNNGATLNIGENIEGTKVISHGLRTFLDYEKGMKYAKEQNKPVLLDFTGHGCENCRKMEDFVWSDPEVLKLLKDDLVLISLYVDEKTELPENEKFVSKTGKEINTIGNKWSDFQIERYETNTQPQYIVLNHEGETISKGSTSYDPDIKKYKAWLEEGIANFKK